MPSRAWKLATHLYILKVELVLCSISHVRIMIIGECVSFTPVWVRAVTAVGLGEPVSFTGVFVSWHRFCQKIRLGPGRSGQRFLFGFPLFPTS